MTHNLIRRMRKTCGLSQEGAGKFTGRSIRSIVAYESGRREIPKSYVLSLKHIWHIMEPLHNKHMPDY